MTPHTPHAASTIFGLASDYFDACEAGNEIMASEAAKAMLEALLSGHAHDHLKLVQIDAGMARRLLRPSSTVMVAVPVSVYRTLVKPLIDHFVGEENEAALQASFATRVWPRATVN